MWPFERNGKSRRISVDGRVMVNDTDLAVRAAVDGLGIAYTIEALAEPFLRSGQLVRVLEDWSPSFEGLFLYYPGHRQVPAALRALIDMIRTARGSAPARAFAAEPFYQRLSGSALRSSVSMAVASARSIVVHAACRGWRRRKAAVASRFYGFTDPGISEYNALQTFVPPRRFL